MDAVKKLIRTDLLPYLLLFIISGVLVASCSLDDQTGEPSPSITNSPVPIETEVPLADLVITSVELLGDRGTLCPAPDQVYQVKVLVENRGAAAGGPFVVQLNLDQQLVNRRLEPGESIEVVFPYSAQDHHAFVDATSLVIERDENNNQVFQKLLLPTPRPECASTPTPIVSTQGALAVFEGHTARVWDVAFSPDGKTIASGSVDNTLRLWNTHQRRLIRTMLGHPFPVLRVAYTPNGATLLTGSTDGLLRSWDVASGRLISTYEGHTGWITGLDIASDGRWYASSAEDSTVRLWRPSSRTSEEIIDEGMTSARDVMFAPDASAIAWGEGDGTVRVRTLGGVWRQAMKRGSQPALSIQFSPDGELLASGMEDGLIRIWRTDDGSLIQTLYGHTDAINDLAFSPEGQWLVSASQDGTLRLWKFEKGSFLTLPVRALVGHEGGVTSVDISPKDPLIVSGSEDATLRLWELPPPTAP